MRLILLVVAVTLAIALLAVAASADNLPPPAAVSSGKDVQLPVDSTAKLTGPWGGLESERQRSFEVSLFLFFKRRRRSKAVEMQAKKRQRFFPELSSCLSVFQYVEDL